jgi:hypothetical protein
LAIIAGNDGLASPNATHADGDVDSDLDVDEDDFVAALPDFGLEGGLGGFNGSLTSDPDPALLLYNSLTGNVRLDQTNAPGGVISTFILESSGAFASPGTAVFPFGIDLLTDQASDIAQTDDASFDPAPGFATNPHDLGPLLSTGLDLAGLNSAISSAVYVGETGTGVREFVLVVVPEPTSLLLFAVGYTVFLWSRRRGAK